jgi:hypothetical protein
MSEGEQEGQKESNESLGPVFRLKKRHDCGEAFPRVPVGLGQQASKQAPSRLTWRKGAFATKDLADSMVLGCQAVPNPMISHGGDGPCLRDDCGCRSR